MEANSKRYRLLIIEDNPGDFLLIEQLLLDQIDAPELFHAKNFTQAKESLTKGSIAFDAILLDLSLPDKTGLPLIQEVIALSPGTPVIVLTGYADIKFSIESLSLGISDYLLKDELNSRVLYKSIVYSLERKRASQALEESERKYSELFQLSPLPMYVFDINTLRFLDVNDSFIKHYGYSRQELMCMNLKEIRPVEDIPAFEAGLHKDSRRSNNTSLGIFRHIKKNGEMIHVDIQSNFVDYKGVKAKVTIATDVTERLNYIKAIELQNEKLREISWLQSHVIRAPLARLMGLVNLMNCMDASQVADRQKTWDYILCSANELDYVIREITDISSPDSEGAVSLKKAG
jgi:PAS domain S-box-containing protein